MDIQKLLTTAWHITHRNRSLWVLSFITFIAIIPSATIAGGLGGISGLLSVPNLGLGFEWLEVVRAWPAWQWAAIWLVAVLVLIVSTTVTYMMQAAILRGVSLAAERGTAVSFRECLALGPARTRRLLGLSLTVSILISIISL
ncbi:MAG: hypothetical protein JNL09_03940, partial [Anaerolineales bacterium]|nr:hypothetical protein [Anaerolineales bacterium]